MPFRERFNHVHKLLTEPTKSTKQWEAFLSIFWCEFWGIPPTDPRAKAPLHEMEQWYIIDSLRSSSVRLEKPLKELCFEDVFQSLPDDPNNPTTYAGIFDKLVKEAGGLDACTPEQLAGFDRMAKEALE